MKEINKKKIDIPKKALLYSIVGVILVVIILLTFVLLIDTRSVDSEEEVYLNINELVYTQGEFEEFRDALQAYKDYYAIRGISSFGLQGVDDKARQDLIRNTAIAEIAEEFNISISKDRLATHLIDRAGTYTPEKYFDLVYGLTPELYLKYFGLPLERYGMLFSLLNTSTASNTDLDKIELALGFIKSQEFSFEEMAKKYTSIPEEGVLGGYIGWIERGEDLTTKVFDELILLVVGDVSEIYNFGNSYQVFKIEGKEQSPLKLELKRIIIEVESLDKLIDKKIDKYEIK